MTYYIDEIDKKLFNKYFNNNDYISVSEEAGVSTGTVRNICLGYSKVTEKTNIVHDILKKRLYDKMLENRSEISKYIKRYKYEKTH